MLHRLDPSLRYVHLWNEGNAHFWKDQFPNGTHVNGEWYAEFYRPVAQALATAFPPKINEAGLPDKHTGVVLGGPVTYSPPFQEKAGRIVDSTWVEWFEPLLRATADDPKLLGWVDFHAYDGPDPRGKCQAPPKDGPNCLNAEAETLEINLQEIGIVGQALGRPGLLTAITETNFALESAADEHDWAQRFKQRGLGLTQQTMALLRYPGLVITRQLFDWGVPVGSQNFYRFLPANPSADPFTPEMEIYRAFANFSGSIRLPGSGWSDQAEASGLQVEGVCVGKWAKPACSKKPCAPPQCDHIKVALVNGGSVDASVGFRVQFCSGVGPGTAVSLDATKVGVQRSAVRCGNVSQTVSVKASALMVIECRCAHA